jgi:cobalt-zinc-cadmium efflux system outer membrane protein
VLELAGGAADDARPVDGVTAQHPALHGFEADARASALEARAARRRWVPELELFAGYRAATAAGDTGHGIALSLSVPLTFFDHGQGEAALASAQQAHAIAEEDQLRRRYAARLQAADAQLAALSKGVAELEVVRAEATTLLDKTRQLYAAGEASLTELLDAIRVAEEAQLAVIDLAEELVHARLARMQASGTQLDEALDKACSGNERTGS